MGTIVQRSLESSTSNNVHEFHGNYQLAGTLWLALLEKQCRSQYKHQNKQNKINIMLGVGHSTVFSQEFIRGLDPD